VKTEALLFCILISKLPVFSISRLTSATLNLCDILHIESFHWTFSLTFIAGVYTTEQLFNSHIAISSDCTSVITMSGWTLSVSVAATSSFDHHPVIYI